MVGEPASVREYDAFRLQSEQALDGVDQLRAARIEQSAEVYGRAAVRRGDAEQARQRAGGKREEGRFEPLDQVRKGQAVARVMEQGSLVVAEGALDHDEGELVAPFGRGLRREIAVQAKILAAGTQALAQTWCGPGDGLRVPVLPLAEEQPVRGTGRDEVTEFAQVVQLLA